MSVLCSLSSHSGRGCSTIGSIVIWCKSKQIGHSRVEQVSNFVEWLSGLDTDGAPVCVERNKYFCMPPFAPHQTHMNRINPDIRSFAVSEFYKHRKRHPESCMRGRCGLLKCFLLRELAERVGVQGIALPAGFYGEFLKGVVKDVIDRRLFNALSSLDDG